MDEDEVVETIDEYIEKAKKSSNIDKYAKEYCVTYLRKLRSQFTEGDKNSNSAHG